MPLPWYKWFSRDWLASETRFELSLAERGLYRDLLDIHYCEGSIPASENVLLKMSSATPEEFASSWPNVSRLFSPHPGFDGRLVNNRALAEIEQRDKYQKTQRLNGLKGGRPKKTDGLATGKRRVSDGLAKRNPNETQTKARARASDSDSDSEAPCPLVGRSVEKETSHSSTGPQPRNPRANAGEHEERVFSDEPTDRPTDPEAEGSEPRREPSRLTTWQPDQRDAERLLAFMRERTGSGDITFAAECLRLVRRDADGLDDILAVLRSKTAGRKIANNGYLRTIIVERFGELPEQAAEREAATRRILDERREAEAGYRVALRAALDAGETEEHLRLMKLGVRGWSATLEAG